MILGLGRKKVAEPSHEEILAKSAIDVLSECCTHNLSAMVVSTSLGLVAKAAFESIDEKQVRLRLHDHIVLRPLVLCCVSFNFKNRSHVFLANVVDMVTVESKTSLTLNLPDQVSFSELRSMFRIPVVDSVDVRSETRICGELYELEVSDINLNGVCLQGYFGQTKLDVGELIDMNLAYSQTSVQISGEVRNVNDGRLGILFTGDKPGDLAKLVRELELEYLRFKKGS